MAMDTLAVACLVRELATKLINGRIDKIHQPEADELLLSIRTFTSAYRLVLSANSSNPRVHFTDKTKDNPKTPPMLCMLLRKHLQSGKIVSVTQPNFERIIEIGIDSYNELGDLTRKTLIIELTGRNSNIILVSPEGKVIDSAKHIDFTMSSVRQILPGMEYHYPPAQDKTPILSELACFPDVMLSEPPERADRAILNGISGISPLTARELVYRATGRCDTVCGELNMAQKELIYEQIAWLHKTASENIFSPVIIKDLQSNRLIDFSAINIEQYGELAEIRHFDSISDAIEEFYTERDNAERMRQKTADLVKLLNTNLDRLSKKLSIQQKTLKDSEKKDQHKESGDLITANIYAIKEGMTEIEVSDFYNEGNPRKIQLMPNLTPSQNAQRYYKLYNKAKTAETEMTSQIISTSAEIDYLESTLFALENCKTNEDISALRAELAAQGYLKLRSENKKNKQTQASKPMHFISSDGFDIYVGKNNTQNDYLTLRFANNSDIWFHTKKIHGSHTIIKLGIDKNVPHSTMFEAAQLAAYFSKARNSSQVPVDYALVKNVKKPNGAKPGMVIYDGYNTVYVNPQIPEGVTQAE